jgi:hypothetical protein
MSLLNKLSNQVENKMFEKTTDKDYDEGYENGYLFCNADAYDLVKSYYPEDLEALVEDLKMINGNLSKSNLDDGIKEVFDDFIETLGNVLANT